MILMPTIALFAVTLIAVYALIAWFWEETKSNSYANRLDNLMRSYTNQAEGLGLAIQNRQDMVDKLNSDYNTLLEILDDTDAELASVSVNYLTMKSEYDGLNACYDNLFKSYEALQAELEKANNGIRKRCPHCGIYLTKDGECRNKKCKSKKILNSTQAAEVIKAGGCVSTIDGDILDDIHYFSLSLKRNGSIGCYNVSIIPHKGWCFANAQKFIDGMEEKNFIQVYPEFLNGKENHVEVKKVEKPLLANAKVGDLCKLKDGKWVQIVRIIENEKYSIVYMYDNVSMTTKINGQYGYWDSNYDIIYTEPLATEGTSKWALQMRKLKKSLIHPESGVSFTADYSNAERVIALHPTGWKLYTVNEPAPEPETEPKPILAGAEVGDKVRLRNGGVTELTSVTNKLKFDLYSYPIAGYYYGDIAWQLDGKCNQVSESPYDVVELIKKGDNK